MKRRTVLRNLAIGGATVGMLGASTGTASAGIPELSCAADLFQVPDDHSATDVTIESFDGTDLAGRLYEPDESGPHPAVLMTHGWGLTKELAHCTAGRYANNGYVVLVYDSRGFGGSEGLVRVSGPNEVEDVSVLLDWLADRESVQSDGDDLRVGMDGGSYAGGLQLQAAANDDRIDAIVPRVAWNDMVYSVAPNDTIKSGWLTALVGAGELVSRLTGDIGNGVDPQVLDWYEQAMDENAFPEDALDYFTARTPATEDIDTPTLVISGWHDTLFTPTQAFANYRQISANGVDTRLLMYSGGHNIDEVTVGDDQTRYIENAALAWLDEHVKGEGGAAGDVPEVSLYSAQNGAWKTYDALPSATEFHIDLGEISGGTSTVRNAPDGAFSVDDVDAVYDVGPAGTFEVVGAPELTLDIETEADDLVLFAKLVHVDAAGETTQIGDQVTPARISSGRHTVTLDMEPLEREVGADESLELVVSATDPFYLAETGEATIHDEGSSLTLPLVESDLPVGDEAPAGDGTYRVTATHSGKALDVAWSDDDDGTDVHQWEYNGDANQHWEFERLYDGSYRITAAHSGKALDVDEGSRDDGADVHQWEYHGDGNQRWLLRSNDDGTYRLVAAHSGKVLDVDGASEYNGADVHQWEDNGGANQHWDLELVE